MKNLLLLVSFFYTVTLYSQDNSNIKGWRKAEWGMSVDSVQKLFSKELTINKITTGSGDEYFVPFEIKDYEIDNNKYDVIFLFNNKTKLLCEIKLRNMCYQYFRDVISSLEPLITQKYGIPSYKTETPYNCKWDLLNTTIELSFIKTVGCILLSYKQKNDEKYKI